jgi:uncharacterized protein YdhG (YjbR/CyaY superfamily)
MDDYLGELSPEQRAAFERVRSVVSELAPDAEEGTSYGVPAFIQAGRPLLGFSAAKKHLSLFPFSPAALDIVRDRLGEFDVAKGTIRFTPERPVPDDVLADLVISRMREITAG